MIKLLAFSLALLFSSNVQAVETNKCFANSFELNNAVIEYVGDGRCDINAQRCAPDPLNCGCDDVDQRDYRGDISTTISGKTCQAWDAQSPHEHVFTPADFPNKGLEGGHNYCRNPDDDSSAWCFTTDPDELFEYCDVPSCGLGTADGSECDIGKKYGWPINTWCVSDITNMRDMFYDASTFNGDLLSWNVSSVTDMWGMFNDASAFNQDLSSWNVSSVTNMDSMFFGASAFNQDLSSWNVSSVTDMDWMFRDASAFNQDLSSWNVSSVIFMNSMFRDASAFNQDLSSWNVSSVTRMGWMFYGASAFNGDLSSWNVASVTTMESMFNGASAFNQDLSSWNVSSVTIMNSMFSYASAFNQDLSSWYVSSVKSMGWMFFAAAAFNGDLSSWNVSSVTSMWGMFQGASAFNRDLCDWADTFNYATSGPIFAESGCAIPHDPERALGGGPFCASTCIKAKLKWKRGDDPFCPDTQN